MSLKFLASFWEFALGFTGFAPVCHVVVCLFVQADWTHPLFPHNAQETHKNVQLSALK